MGTEIIIAIIGTITTLLGAILGNAQGRKKSNAEAGLMQVKTLEEIRKFYETTIISQSELVIKRDARINALELELNLWKQKVDVLQQVVQRLMNRTLKGDQDEAITFTPKEFSELLKLDAYVDEQKIKKEQNR